jgi:ABC-type xylose transport system substrate-binding protein
MSAQSNRIILEAADIIIANTLSVNGSTIDNKSQNVELTATSTLTIADSGKTFFLNSATEFDTALPAVADAAGFTARFIIKAAPSGADYTITSPGSDIHGLIASNDLTGASDAASTAGTPIDVISFVDAKALIGDYVDLRCDGTNYYVSGVTSVFDGVTLA